MLLSELAISFSKRRRSGLNPLPWPTLNALVLLYAFVSHSLIAQVVVNTDLLAHHDFLGVDVL